MVTAPRKLRLAADAALALAERLRDALPEVADSEEKAYMVKLTAAVSKAQGWLEVLDAKLRARLEGAS